MGQRSNRPLARYASITAAMLPRVSDAAPSMTRRGDGLRMSDPSLSVEGVDDRQVAGSIDGMQAEQSGAAGGNDALRFALGEALGREAQHAVDRQAGAV